MRKARVLYRYLDEVDRERFVELFAQDFDITISQQHQEGNDSEKSKPLDCVASNHKGSVFESEMGSDYAAIVLDGDDIDTGCAKDLKQVVLKESSEVFCAHLHDNIGLSDIVRLLEDGVVDKFYAKPYDANIVRSDIYASTLNLSLLDRQYAQTFRTQERAAVLLVDDETTATKFLVKQLARLECPADLYVASSAEEALTLVDDIIDRLAVVISDQRMPGMQGNQLLAQLYQSNPHIIRILTSAYNEVDIALNAVNEGRIFRYIQKPWNAGEINDLIKISLFEFHSAMKKSRLRADEMMQAYQLVIENRKARLRESVSGLLKTDWTAEFLDHYLSELSGLCLLPISKGAIRSSQETNLETSLLESLKGQVADRLSKLSDHFSQSQQDDDHDRVCRTLSYFGDNGCSQEQSSLSFSEVTVLESILSDCLNHLLGQSRIEGSQQGGAAVYCLESKHFPWLYKHALSPISQISSVFVRQQSDLLVLAALLYGAGFELLLGEDSGVASVRFVSREDGHG